MSALLDPFEQRWAELCGPSLVKADVALVDLHRVGIDQWLVVTIDGVTRWHVAPRPTVEGRSAWLHAAAESIHQRQAVHAQPAARRRA